MQPLQELTIWQPVVHCRILPLAYGEVQSTDTIEVRFSNQNIPIEFGVLDLNGIFRGVQKNPVHTGGTDIEDRFDCRIESLNTLTDRGLVACSKLPNTAPHHGRHKTQP